MCVPFLKIFLFAKGLKQKIERYLQCSRKGDEVTKSHTVVESNKKAATSTKSSRETDGSDDEKNVRNCKL